MKSPEEHKGPKSAEDIRQTFIDRATDLKREKIYIPRTDQHVWVREMTAKERDEFDQQEVTQKPGSDELSFNLDLARARIAIMCTVDEDGNRVFNDGDEYQLAQSSSQAVDRIFDAAQRLSGISDDDIQELKEISGN